MILDAIKKGIDIMANKLRVLGNKEQEEENTLEYLPKQEEIKTEEVNEIKGIVVRIRFDRDEIREMAKFMWLHLEVARLSKILVRTRKPRVKKKLVRRIIKIKRLMWEMTRKGGGKCD